MEERVSTGATGKNWLFFGEVHEESTFFYKDEWFEYMKNGHLTKLTTAFSRDQKEKIYVQNRITNNGKEIWRNSFIDLEVKEITNAFSDIDAFPIIKKDIVVITSAIGKLFAVNKKTGSSKRSSKSKALFFERDILYLL